MTTNWMLHRPYYGACQLREELANAQMSVAEYACAIKREKEPIAKRLQLANLVDWIGEALDRNTAWIGQAYMLAEVDQHLQRELYRAATVYSVLHFQAIWDKARKFHVRVVAKDCWESLMLDMWPRPAAICDFGLDSTTHYSTLQYAIKNGVSLYELDYILGSGLRITAACDSFVQRPYQGVVFKTAYDR